MNRTSSRPSLLTRISESKSRATSTVDRSYYSSPRQESFVDRYRGTEFESPTREFVVPQDHVSRGRSFVVVVGVALVGLIGTLLVTATG